MIGYICLHLFVMGYLGLTFSIRGYIQLALYITAYQNLPPVHDGLFRPTVLFLTVGYFDLVHDELYGPRLFLKAIYRQGRLYNGFTRPASYMTLNINLKIYRKLSMLNTILLR
jgi:hypothetical protein